MDLAAFASLVHGWANFYSLVGTAAATLSGLMSNFTHSIHILIIACVLTVPTLTPFSLGTLLIISALSRLAAIPWIYRHIAKAHATAGDIDGSAWVIHVIAPVGL